ncbi:MAG: hypothetical protein F6K17_21080 [Okeania sp. SIO3C4]|nr:hypothetical protein [Okeania sp. SIO3B3]NER04915.1 hypothetical protein [Okeania sp. SIO3C4]
MSPGQFEQYFLLIQSDGIETARGYRTLVESANYYDRQSPVGPIEWRSPEAREASYRRRYEEAKWQGRFGDHGNKRPGSNKRYHQ